MRVDRLTTKRLAISKPIEPMTNLTKAITPESAVTPAKDRALAEVPNRQAAVSTANTARRVLLLKVFVFLTFSN